jgi:predicted adenylyl cyclase CyaB
MALEIEAKMKLANRGLVVRRLGQLGARSAGQVLETNIFFDTEDGDLQTAGSGLRLRRSVDARGKQKLVLTAKGPMLPGPLKVRPEAELTVTSAADAEQFLAQLGYRKTLLFEKRRQSFLLESCRIELDELPLLGRFIEIEGPTQAAVMDLRKRLGLGRRRLIKSGYASLLRQHLRRCRKPLADIRF